MTDYDPLLMLVLASNLVLLVLWLVVDPLAVSRHRRLRVLTTSVFWITILVNMVIVVYQLVQN